MLKPHPPPITAPHHSVLDWDFLKVPDWSDFTHWGLTTGYFVSPPSSMYLVPWAADPECYVLSKLPEAQDVKAGSMTTWTQEQAPGVGDPHIHIGVTGVGDRGIVLSLNAGIGSFSRTRYDWWQGFDEQNDPATFIDSYNWNGVAWVYISRQYKPPMSGLLNRLGIGTTVQSLASAKFFDDTEIWLPI